MAASEVIKDTICYMCTVGCNMKVHVSDGIVTKVEPAHKGAGLGCPKWNAQVDLVYHPDRLKYPLKRTGERGSGKFERISWDEALDTTAGKLRDIKSKYGAEAVAFWIAFTKEPRPYFQRLTHAFGSPNYCTESSSCASSVMLAVNLTYGTPHGIFPPGIKRHPKCRMIWGSSIQHSSPWQWPSITEAKRNGVKLIVIDPRRTRLAEMSDIHLQPRPGTDGALALAIINVIISEKLHDEGFIARWSTGFEDLVKLAADYPLDRAEKITWVPDSKIRGAAILFATQKPAHVETSICSTTHHSNGLQNHRAIILLNSLTGNIEAPAPVPAGSNLNDITLFERVKNMPPGIGAQQFPIWTEWYHEMQSNALAGQIDSGKPYPIKALFAAGLDFQFFPNAQRFKSSLNKLDFIAVTEYFQTAGTGMADIILPIASWWERQGLFFNFYHNKITMIEPVIEPLGECWPEWKIFSELAKRLGFGQEFWDGDFKRCVNYIMEPAGITYEHLKQHPEGIPIPLRTPDKTGFPTPSGKIEIASSVLARHGFDALPVYKEPPESPLSTPELAKTYPLVLTTGARVAAFTHSQYRNIPRLRRLMPDPLADINPIDAAPRNIISGDTVVISSPRGSIKMKANVTDTILFGVVSIPHHWPAEANANILVDDATLDPISGFPPFKSQLCQVKKA